MRQLFHNFPTNSILVGISLGIGAALGIVGGPTKPNEDANRWLVGPTVAWLGNRWES